MPIILHVKIFFLVQCWNTCIKFIGEKAVSRTLHIRPIQVIDATVKKGAHKQLIFNRLFQSPNKSHVVFGRVKVIWIGGCPDKVKVIQTSHLGKVKVIQTRGHPSKVKFIQTSGRPGKVKVIQTSGHPGKVKVIQTSGRPSKVKVIQTSGRSGKVKVIQTSGRPGKVKVLETRGHPGKVKVT